MSTKKKSETEDVPFEAAMQELERIVTELDTGTLNLDQSLSSFEEGMKLAKLCEQKLDQASGRVEKIMQDFSGEIKTVAFGNADTGDDDGV